MVRSTPPELSSAIDRRAEEGPFDIIGDVHGCVGELKALLSRLGYRAAASGWTFEGAGRKRRAVFVGDLVDRGPSSAAALGIAMSMVASGAALAVPGNHDDKLKRWLEGRNVQLKHGLAATTEELKAEPEAFRADVQSFITGLPSHLWLDGGSLVVAHAGIRSSMIGQASERVRDFCLYGDTGGGLDEHGLPVRYDWALEHPGTPAVVYGHTPVREATWRNNTLCIDTGCVFGGSLAALRWPERELVSVPAVRAYAEARRWGHPPPRPR